MDETYIALLRKERKSDYGVDFPDFPGCVTAGKTLEDAREMAAEALQFHIEGMLEDGEALPEPTTLDEIMKDRHNRDAVAFLVTVPAGRPKLVRVNISVPESELRKIDAIAQRLGKSRSSVLIEGALTANRRGAARSG